MHLKRTFILASIAAAALLAACGEYNNLLKSTDYRLVYRKALEFFEAGKYQRAANLLEMAGPYFAGTIQEDSVAYFLARSHFKMKDYDTSAELFDQFRRRYGRSPFIEEVEGMYALSFYLSSPAAERDQTMTLQAIGAITTFIGRYPNSTRRAAFEQMLRELNQKLHDKVYLNARTYYKIGRYKSAVVALKNALKQFPETNHREEMLYLIVKSGFRLADNSVERLQRDRFLDMLDSYYSFISEFPKSRYVRELDHMRDVAKAYLAEQSPAQQEPAESENTQSTSNGS